MTTNKKESDHAFEVKEDEVLNKIAAQRDAEDGRYISHDKAWESNSNTYV